MSTVISSVSSTKFDVRRREQYASRALNRRLAQEAARGIVRGFIPKPSLNPLELTLHVDPLTQDSTMVVRGQNSSNLEAIAYKEEVDLDVDLNAFAGTTIYLGVRHNYTIGADTEVEIVAYDQAEFDAGTTGEGVLVCVVDVPGAGIIPNANIGEWVREEQWQWDGGYGRKGWVDGIDFNISDLNLDFGALVDGSTSTITRDLVDARVPNETTVLATGPGTIAIIPRQISHCTPGERITAKIWGRASGATAWTINFRLVATFLDNAGGILGTANLVDVADTDTDWHVLGGDAEAPAGAVAYTLQISGELSAGTYRMDALWFGTRSVPTQAGGGGWFSAAKRVIAGWVPAAYVNFNLVSTLPTRFGMYQLIQDLLVLELRDRVAPTGSWLIGSATDQIDVTIDGDLDVEEDLDVQGGMDVQGPSTIFSTLQLAIPAGLALNIPFGNMIMQGGTLTVLQTVAFGGGDFQTILGTAVNVGAGRDFNVFNGELTANGVNVNIDGLTGDATFAGDVQGDNFFFSLNKLLRRRLPLPWMARDNMHKLAGAVTSFLDTTSGGRWMTYSPNNTGAPGGLMIEYDPFKGATLQEVRIGVSALFGGPTFEWFLVIREYQKDGSSSANTFTSAGVTQPITGGVEIQEIVFSGINLVLTDDDVVPRLDIYHNSSSATRRVCWVEMVWVVDGLDEVMGWEL